MTTEEMQHEALDRARSGNSLRNYEAIFTGFTGKGIAEAEIDPRRNIFTFTAWKALGRCVRKGEHGVKIFSWVPASKDVTRNGVKTKEDFKFVRTVTVFHISQTDLMPEVNH